MKSDYLEKEIGGRPAFVRRDSAEELSSADLFAFDCDGTLIDTEGLFLRAMIGATEKLLSDLHGRKLILGKSAKRMLSLFRQTGEYNSDWDSTFAMTCTVSMALSEYEGGKGSVPGAAVTERAEVLASEFTSSGMPKGVQSFRDFVERQYSARGKEGEFRRVMDYLSYPGDESTSPVCRTYSGWYENDGRDGSGGKAFEREAAGTRTLVDSAVLESLLSAAGGRKHAIITGSDRSFVESVLGPLSEYFDMDRSTFIGDLDISDRVNMELYSKPSPASLSRVMEGAGDRHLLYTGDSAEDLMMARLAKERGMAVLFAGVTASALDPDGFRRHFMRNGADAVLSGADQLVRLIEDLRGADSKSGGRPSPP